MNSSQVALLSVAAGAVLLFLNTFISTSSIGLGYSGFNQGRLLQGRDGLFGSVVRQLPDILGLVSGFSVAESARAVDTAIATIMRPVVAGGAAVDDEWDRIRARVDESEAKAVQLCAAVSEPVWDRTAFVPQALTTSHRALKHSHASEFDHELRAAVRDLGEDGERVLVFADWVHSRVVLAAADAVRGAPDTCDNSTRADRHVSNLRDCCSRSFVLVVQREQTQHPDPCDGRWQRAPVSTTQSPRGCPTCPTLLCLHGVTLSRPSTAEAALDDLRRAPHGASWAARASRVLHPRAHPSPVLARACALARPSLIVLSGAQCVLDATLRELPHACPTVRRVAVRDLEAPCGGTSTLHDVLRAAAVARVTTSHGAQHGDGSLMREAAAMLGKMSDTGNRGGEEEGEQEVVHEGGGAAQRTARQGESDSAGGLDGKASREAEARRSSELAGASHPRRWRQSAFVPHRWGEDGSVWAILRRQ